MNTHELRKRRDSIGKSVVIVSVIMLICVAIFGLLNSSFQLTEISGTDYRFILSMAGYLLLFSCVFYFSYLSRGIQRIERLLYTEMDSVLVEQELPDLFEMLGRFPHGRSMKQFYEGQRDLLDGKYEEALTLLNETKFRRSQNYYSGTCYCKSLALLRIGKIAEAEIELNTLRKTKIPIGNITYLEALIHLEKGEIDEAKKLYDLHIFSRPFHEMNVVFDQGRLDELRGHLDMALTKYRKAAALGPKVWIGQEAVKRLDALNPATLSQ